MTLVSPGQDLNIAARDWNEVQRMLAWWKRGGPNLLRQRGNGEFSQTRAWVKNNSATDRGRFEILGLDDELIDSSYNGWSESLNFAGNTPTTASHWGKFCVTLEPIKAGAIGRCCVAGVTHCKLNVVHAADWACDVTNNSGANLTTAAVGTARILSKGAVGTGLGFIRIGDPIVNFVGKADGTVTVGNTGTVSVWDAAFAGDLGNNVTSVYNHTSDWASGDKLSGVIINGVAYAAKLTC